MTDAKRKLHLARQRRRHAFPDDLSIRASLLDRGERIKADIVRRIPDADVSDLYAYRDPETRELVLLPGDWSPAEVAFIAPLELEAQRRIR